MTVGLDPIVVAVGPVAIRWSGVLTLAGIGLAVWITVRGAAARGLPRGAVLDSAAWVLPAGVVGGRVFEVVGTWELYVAQPADAWRFDVSGVSFWGALLAGGWMLALTWRRNPAARLLLADAAVPGVALGIVLGRLGAFVNGDDLGQTTDLPWAVQYTRAAAAVPDFGVPRHPVMLYDVLASLLIWGAVASLARGSPPGGQAWSFLALYAAARVALTGVRLETPFLFGVSLDSLAAWGVLGFAAAQLARTWWGQVRTPRRSAPGAP